MLVNAQDREETFFGFMFTFLHVKVGFFLSWGASDLFTNINLFWILSIYKKKLKTYKIKLIPLLFKKKGI